MHTLMVLTVGFLILAALVAIGRSRGRAGIGTGALVFLPLWLVGAAINMYVGVARAGYGVADEFPVFLVVFGVPAIAALFIWWTHRSTASQ